MSILYKIKSAARHILPSFVVNFLKKIENLLKKIRGFYYANKNFNYYKAQAHEFYFGVNWMKKGNFKQAYNCWELAKQEGVGSTTAYKRISLTTDPTFFSDKHDFDNFCKKVSDKKCLEIGSATEGILVLMPWVDERIIIDPLIKKYRESQLTLYGKTFLTDDIKLYDQKAESLIPEIVGKIDGCIVCRNTLDHSEEPWKILEKIGEYAADGCVLLLWTDLWHFEPLDAGHRNITKDVTLFENKIKEIGFDIEYVLPEIRDRRQTIHYGCVAIKRQNKK